VGEEQRHKCAQSFRCVSFAPVVGIEHVSNFWGADSAYETDYGWTPVWLYECDGEVPVVGLVVTALYPGLRLKEGRGGQDGTKCMLEDGRVSACTNNKPKLGESIQLRITRSFDSLQLISEAEA
jgi:hypothetical protein